MANTAYKTIPLSKTTKFVVDNRGKTAPIVPTGIPLIATNCVSNEDLYPTHKNVRYVSNDTYQNWFRAHPLPGDILLTLKGSQNGAVCLVPDPVDFVIAQDMVALRTNDTVMDPLFLFAALRSRQVQAQIKNLDVSGVIPHFKKTDFDKLLMPYPDRLTQEFIGELHFNLCASVESNRRMNETLEALARAIFKDWFVDFGPAYAKTEGREAYLPPELWTMFPLRFNDEGVPVGWRTGEIGDVALVVDCLHSKKPQRREFGKVLLQLWNIRNDGLLDLTDPYYVSEEEYALWISRLEASSGDCVITNVGRVGAVAQVPSDVRAALGRNMTAIRCRDDFPFPTFLIESLLSGEMRTEIERRTDAGTILSALNVRSIPKLTLTVPPNPIAEAFERHARPLRERMERNHSESIALAAMRDLLVPKLMSGEICVRDAEKMAEAVL